MKTSLRFLFPQKGFVLVFSLIVMAFLLISSFSIATLSAVERRTSSATDRSTRSFQIADSGAELVLQKIYKGGFSTLDDLADSLDTECDSQGEIRSTINSGTYTVSFYEKDSDGDIKKLTHSVCDDIAWRDRVVQIKSEGVSQGTTRAIEVEVAAPAP